MKKSNIIAHRGLWTTASEANSRAALFDAIIQGFGVETDIRDGENFLEIAHDPFESQAFILDDLVRFYVDKMSHGRLALNVKSHGLAQACSSMIEKFDVREKCFFFDMSIPDLIQYQHYNLPFYIRVSEFEDFVTHFTGAGGAWLDAFSNDFDQLEVLKDLIQSGERVCIVSPELHGRHHEALWSQIIRFGLHLYDNFEICTDYPVRALEIFSE